MSSLLLFLSFFFFCPLLTTVHSRELTLSLSPGNHLNRGEGGGGLQPRRLFRNCCIAAAILLFFHFAPRAGCRIRGWAWPSAAVASISPWATWVVIIYLFIWPRACSTILIRLFITGGRTSCPPWCVNWRGVCARALERGCKAEKRREKRERKGGEAAHVELPPRLVQCSACLRL